MSKLTEDQHRQMETHARQVETALMLLQQSSPPGEDYSVEWRNLLRAWHLYTDKHKLKSPYDYYVQTQDKETAS
jgi:hypothetical protein